MHTTPQRLTPVPVPPQLQHPPSVYAHGQHGPNGQHGSDATSGHRGLRPTRLHDEHGTASHSPCTAQERGRRRRRRRLWLLARSQHSAHTLSHSLTHTDTHTQSMLFFKFLSCFSGSCCKQRRERLFIAACWPKRPWRPAIRATTTARDTKPVHYVF